MRSSSTELDSVATAGLKAGNRRLSNSTSEIVAICCVMLIASKLPLSLLAFKAMRCHFSVQLTIFRQDNPRPPELPIIPYLQ